MKTRKMKLFGICGSPRASGNTAKLVQAVLGGGAREGLETEFILLGSKHISFCKGCGLCMTGEECPIDDAVGGIRAKMMEARGVVFGSPVYLGDISGQMKTFLDRLCQDVHFQNFKDHFSALVVTYVAHKGTALDTLRNFSLASGFNRVRSVVSKLDEFDNDIEKDTSSKNEAEKLGETLGNIIKGGKIPLKQKLSFFWQDFKRKHFVQAKLKTVDELMEKSL